MVNAGVKPVSLNAGADLTALFQWLQAGYGHQDWWPAEERFEILIGAILVQNTAWSNVEKAIAVLRDRGWLSPCAILSANENELAEAIRPSGYFRIKAQRLRALCRWFEDGGGFDGLDKQSTTALRQSFLSVKGVGPETADAILLYAFDRPVFVIDAYTQRLLVRLGWIDFKPRYEALRAVFELTLPADVEMFAQYHALIVEHAKSHCLARPLCADCMLKTHCVTGLAA